HQSGIDPDRIIFASRHTSKTARPAMLIHTTGNWSDDATFGGDAYRLSQTSALLQKAGFFSLNTRLKRAKLPTFRFDMEVTHHGPTNLRVPLVYMELGSSKKEWSVTKAGEIVGNAIVDTIFRYLNYIEMNEMKIGLGFGGTHYAPNFKNVMELPNIALSFICPKYYIQTLDKKMISQMIDNTSEKIDFFIIDWKGTNSKDKKHLLPLLEDFAIPVKKTKDF
ncbi:MAG: hypothetical protein EU517_00330, partial [Promethearchaeota archaeon]